jgi:glycosyltransferase involved in cell wall biosynthesis
MTRSGLRFAMITTFYPPYHFGGDAYYVRQLAHTLVKRGHEVDVIHDIDAYRLLSRDPNPEPVSEPPGLQVFGMQSRMGAVSCLATQQLGRPLFHGREIAGILRDRQHDVINYHNISLVGGPGILGYGDAIKIYTAHEHWLVCPTHVLWRHNREPCDQKQCLRCTLNYRRPPQLWRSTGLLARQTRHVDAFCALSHFSANKHREYGFRREMEILPSFIPDKVPLPAGVVGDRQPAGRPYFLFVGRLEKIKGLQDVIPLFRENPPADLLIAGEGEYGAALRAFAGDAEHIHFLGKMPSEQLQPLYAGALAVILPSICYEVFPLVALEAFREGTPVIARNLGPFPEIIDTSQAGLLFENRMELENAIHRMAGDSEFRNAAGAAAAQAFIRHWSETASMQAYFQLIRRIAVQRNRRGVLDVLDSSGQSTAGHTG